MKEYILKFNFDDVDGIFLWNLDNYLKIHEIDYQCDFEVCSFYFCYSIICNKEDMMIMKLKFPEICT